MERLKTIFDLLKNTFTAWNDDDAPRLAAAIAYYVALSIAPLLVVVIVAVGLIYSEASVQNEIIGQVESAVGEDAASLVENLINSASNLQGGIVPTLIGVFTLLFGAINVFSHLRSALNVIWDAEEPEAASTIVVFLVDKLLSFGMILIIGFLLLVSLVLSTVLSAIGGILAGSVPGAGLLLEILSIVVSLGLITLLFALIYRVLPSVKLAWRDLFIGAAVTAILFTIGQTVLSLYLANSGVASIYGVVGSFILILLWIYYSTQIVLFGAEFTKIYAEQQGEESETNRLDDQISQSLDSNQSASSSTGG